MREAAETLRNIGLETIHCAGYRGATGLARARKMAEREIGFRAGEPFSWQQLARCDWKEFFR